MVHARLRPLTVVGRVVAALVVLTMLTAACGEDSGTTTVAEREDGETTTTTTPTTTTTTTTTDRATATTTTTETDERNDGEEASAEEPVLEDPPGGYEITIRTDPEQPLAGQPVFFDVVVVEPDGPPPVGPWTMWGDGTGGSGSTPGCGEDSDMPTSGRHELRSREVVEEHPESRQWWTHTYEEPGRYTAELTFQPDACAGAEYEQERQETARYTFTVLPT